MGFKKDRAEEAPVSNQEVEKIIEIAKEVFPEAHVEEIKEPEQVIKKPVITEETERKLNLGITGDTVEVRDFRAIVKKSGKQINVVLTGILSEWNAANYNL